MDRLIQTDTREVWLGEALPANPVTSPFGGGDFALLLVDFGGSLSGGERRALARSLVKQMCRYAVCAGHDSDQWETDFDEADLESNPDCDVERFVMTTSHRTEPLDQVAWFFLWNTATPYFQPTRYFVLTVGARITDIDGLKAILAKAAVDAA